VDDAQTGPLVQLKVADGVAVVTLDSPRNRNALSRQLLADLEAALDDAIVGSGVRVIVLTGNGPAFCSGADLKEQREARQTGTASPLSVLPRIFTKIWECPQPVVGRLNGPVRAGGVGLIASCDLVVAPANVTFSFTEVRLGLVPAVISVPVLRRVPAQQAHRLFLTGEVFGAGTARDIGLIDEVAGEGALDAATDKVVEILLRGAPEALAMSKQLAHGIAALPPGEAFPRLTAISEERFASDEGQEGMNAFAEKRDPSWIPAPYRVTG
jgi:methylglutaconyl-CoA hydratase